MAGIEQMIAMAEPYYKPAAKKVKELKERVENVERRERILLDDKATYPCTEEDIKSCKELLNTHGEFKAVMEFLNNDEKIKDDEDFKIGIKNAYNVIKIDEQISIVHNELTGLYKQLNDAEDLYNQKMAEAVDVVHEAFPDKFTLCRRKGNTGK